MPFRIKAGGGPYTAHIDVGGALPFVWALYEYVKDGANWRRKKLGTGDGNDEFPLPSMNAGVLTWSVLTINNDPDPQPVNVTAQLVDATGHIQTVKMSTKVSKAEPSFFADVHVEVAP
ncbi:hypothetical protein ACLESO_13625 [Pyxidicoccus sp. 3LG]